MYVCVWQHAGSYLSYLQRAVTYMGRTTPRRYLTLQIQNHPLASPINPSTQPLPLPFFAFLFLKKKPQSKAHFTHSLAWINSTQLIGNLARPAEPPKGGGGYLRYNTSYLIDPPVIPPEVKCTKCTKGTEIQTTLDIDMDMGMMDKLSGNLSLPFPSLSLSRIINLPGLRAGKAKQSKPPLHCVL